MTRKVEAFDYTIGSHFLSALINGDYSGLEDDEDAKLEVFEQEVRELHGIGHWAMPTEEDREEFAMCEVEGMRGHCHNMQYIIISFEGQ